VVEIEPSWWSSQENLETEFRVLRSESQAVAVARRCASEDLGRPARPCASSSPHQLHEPIGLRHAGQSIQGVVRVDPVKESRIVT
jgi:hypothetical protein